MIFLRPTVARVFHFNSVRNRAITVWSPLCVARRVTAMDAEDSDPELKAAIAASLQDHPLQRQPGNKSAESNIVDLTGDSDNEQQNRVILEDSEEEDEDLKRAIALSLLEASSLESPATGAGKESNGIPKASATKTETEIPSAFGIPGLDRKKLEEERLARVAKRKASMAVSPPPTGRQSKMPRGDTPTAKMSAGNRSGPPSAAPGMQFPRGEVRKTWAFGCPREADIKIEEVLQRGDLELAILSSFQWDMEWLFSKLNTRSSRFLLVMQAKDDATKRQYERETADMPNLRLCFPPMDGQVNCMHSKLMLLFHPTYLRIVVPSANLVPYDWGESGGIMENIVFLIDLPKRTSDSFKPTPFYEDLVYFLRASTLHENIIAKISTFDFSETTRYAFVHTIGGSHTNDTCHRTGHQGLARAVSRMGLATEQEIQVDYVTSSVGSLNEDFLRHLYRSVQGQPSEPKPTSTGVSGFMNNFRAYYPSQQTVHRSKGGPMNAGTICFQEKWFLGPRFPKSVMRDCVSRREGILMHNKILFARFRKPIPFRPMSVKKDAEEGQENETCTAWAYVGSANLSESAWGKLVQDRVTKKPKLNCRNWECGVIVPVTSSAPSAPTTEQGDVDREADFASVFYGTIPVPMKVPGERYREDGGLRPWYGMMF